MIVDTSAILAIPLDEPEAEQFARVIHRADEASIAAPTVLEAMIVAEGRFGLGGSTQVRDLLNVLGVQVISFDDEMADIALFAFQKFGKGRHPASLNFGDCCAYALAWKQSLPLLSKGRDFARTDIIAAI